MHWISPVTAGLAGLVVGALAGYSLPRGNEMPPPERQGNSTAGANVAPDRPKVGSPNRTLTGSPSSPRSAPGSAGVDLLRSLPKRDDRSGRDLWVKNLAPGDVPTLVAGLCADAGPGGLEDEDRRLIQDALQKWWQSDSGAVLGWLRQLPNGGTKRYLVSSVLEDLARYDPARAASLAESFKAQDPGWNDAKLQDSLVKREVEAAWNRPDVTAEEMLQLYARFSRGNSTMGERISMYPAGFDFRKFLEGLAALNTQHGNRISHIPSDTLQEWAKIDPQAAVQWFMDARNEEQPHRHLSFADWDSIVSGVAASRGPQSYHQWAANILAQPNQAELRKVILQESESADLVGIVGQMTSTAERDAALAAAVTSESWKRKEDIDLLGMISTPEARLQVLRSAPERFHEWIQRGRRDPSFWARAGLTTQQVSAALAAGANP